MTRGQPRTRETERHARLAALACALSTLLAALAAVLVVCARPSLVHPASAAHRSHHAAAGHALSARTQDRPVQGPTVQRTAALAYVCSALDHGRGSGCDGASEHAADATLPGPLPQPSLAALPYQVLLPASPASLPRGPLPGSDLAPDLHVLQVQRT